MKHKKIDIQKNEVIILLAIALSIVIFSYNNDRTAADTQQQAAFLTSHP